MSADMFARCSKVLQHLVCETLFIWCEVVGVIHGIVKRVEGKNIVRMRLRLDVCFLHWALNILTGIAICGVKPMVLAMELLEGHNKNMLV